METLWDDVKIVSHSMIIMAKAGWPELRQNFIFDPHGTILNGIVNDPAFAEF
jgi:hypothetical protein